MKELAEKLKELRKQKGITQQKCSEDTGISVRTITRYENGHNIGEPYNLRILANYYNVSMDYLYNEASDKIQ